MAKVTLPEPSCMILPEPLMTPAILWLVLEAKINKPALAMLEDGKLPAPPTSNTALAVLLYRFPPVLDKSVLLKVVVP